MLAASPCHTLTNSEWGACQTHSFYQCVIKQISSWGLTVAVGWTLRYVLESPHEVTTFQYNPLNPDIIIGGCYNGQIIMWDTSSTAAAAAAASTAGPGSKAGGAHGGGGAGASRAGGKGSMSGGAGVWDDGGEAEAVTPVIRHK